MKKFFSDFAQPLSVIWKKPHQYLVWWLVAMFVGLASFWLPFILRYLVDGTQMQFTREYFKSGSMASFSIVILADGLATCLVVANSGRNHVTAGIKGILGVTTLILVVLNVGILALSAFNISSHGLHIVQLLITLLSILTASYLYCFRDPSWEKTVGDVQEEENEEVDNLGRTATQTSADESGNKL